MITWYRETVLETGRSAVFFLLVAFVITFAITRFVTRRIRAQAGKPQEPGRLRLGNIKLGGVHVHHQVWGILLVLTSALFEFAYRPDSPWLEVLSGAFGAGAALTLDEFALWLHLDDVYWSEEGRASIDAVVIAACLGAALLLGSAPLGVDPKQESQAGLAALAATIGANVVCSLLALLKGKLRLGLVGIFVPVVSAIAAIRLAKPSSPWARWRYTRRPGKLARAERRFCADHAARLDRWRDLIGGAPGR